MSYYNAVTLAKFYATAAHGAIQQRRKYTGDPYIVHPTRVAITVVRYGGDANMQCAAYLHDVVEDTGVTIVDIQDMFGVEIAQIVDGLTDVSLPTDGYRAVRKAIDREHSANASYAAQFVKCADIIDNSSDISENDLKFAAVYRKEMTALLAVLDKVIDTPIWTAAVNSVLAMPYDNKENL
tara:strand:+ start:4251 stop:4793 length:543 start_codon:yes stop_codon:yes gene_type:complete